MACWTAEYCACEPPKAAGRVLAVVQPGNVGLAFGGGCDCVQRTKQVEPRDDEEAEQDPPTVTGGVLVRKLSFEAAEEVFCMAFFVECC